MSRPSMPPPLITPSLSPPGSYALPLPLPLPLLAPGPSRSASASPAKRPRLASTPSSFSAATPVDDHAQALTHAHIHTPSRTPSSRTHTPSRPHTPAPTPDDLHAARAASSLRLLNVWTNLADKYARRLDDDDIIDLRTAKIVQDRGVLRATGEQFNIGFFSAADSHSDNGGDQTEDEGGHTEAEGEGDDDVDEIDAFAPEANLSDELEVEAIALPPVEVMNPLDAEDLRDFMEAEQYSKETFGDLEGEVDTGKGDDEDDFDSSGWGASTERELDGASYEDPEDEGDEDERDHSDDNREPLKVVSAERALSPTDDESEDEFAGWDIGEGSSLYEVVQDEDGASDALDNDEIDGDAFVGQDTEPSPPPLSSSPQKSPQKRKTDSPGIRRMGAAQFSPPSLTLADPSERHLVLPPSASALHISRAATAAQSRSPSKPVQKHKQASAAHPTTPPTSAKVRTKAKTTSTSPSKRLVPEVVIVRQRPSLASTPTKAIQHNDADADEEEDRDDDSPVASSRPSPRSHSRATERRYTAREKGKGRAADPLPASARSLSPPPSISKPVPRPNSPPVSRSKTKSHSHTSFPTRNRDSAPSTHSNPDFFIPETPSPSHGRKRKRSFLTPELDDMPSTVRLSQPRAHRATPFDDPVYEYIPPTDSPSLSSPLHRHHRAHMQRSPSPLPARARSHKPTPGQAVDAQTEEWETTWDHRAPSRARRQSQPQPLAQTQSSTGTYHSYDAQLSDSHSSSRRHGTRLATPTANPHARMPSIAPETQYHLMAQTMQNLLILMQSQSSDALANAHPDELPMHMLTMPVSSQTPHHAPTRHVTPSRHQSLRHARERSVPTMGLPPAAYTTPTHMRPHPYPITPSYSHATLPPSSPPRESSVDTDSELEPEPVYERMYHERGRVYISPDTQAYDERSERARDRPLVLRPALARARSQSRGRRVSFHGVEPGSTDEEGAAVVVEARGNVDMDEEEGEGDGRARNHVRGDARDLFTPELPPPAPLRKGRSAGNAQRAPTPTRRMRPTDKDKDRTSSLSNQHHPKHATATPISSSSTSKKAPSNPAKASTSAIQSHPHLHRRDDRGRGYRERERRPSGSGSSGSAGRGRTPGPDGHGSSSSTGR